jgi:hypothetical protein
MKNMRFIELYVLIACEGRMVFATPPLTCTPNLVAEINSCGILNTFLPWVNTLGGGVAPSAPQIMARIAAGY